MMVKSYFSSVAVALIACLPYTVTINGIESNEVAAASFSGGSDGGGGDTIYPWTDSAWFVGKDRVVNVCFERVANFSVDERGVTQAIEDAYKVWADYLAAKTGEVNHTVDVDLPTQVKVSRVCTGAEDLKFYFGVFSPDVKKIWRKFSDPIAFAYRDSYKTTTWDHGIVWVSDDATAARLLGATWAAAGVLKGILVHEVGHALGCGHVNGTVMRENIVSFLKIASLNPPNVRDIMISNVDWTDDLIENGFNFDYLGSVYGFDPPQLDKVYSQWFKELMGRAPKGKVYSRFWRRAADFHLVVADDAGQKDFVLHDFRNVGSVSRQKNVFHIYREREYLPSGDSNPDVILSEASVITASKVKARVTLQRGGGLDGAWEVHYFPLRGGGPWSVFIKRPGGLAWSDFRHVFDVPLQLPTSDN